LAAAAAGLTAVAELQAEARLTAAVDLQAVAKLPAVEVAQTASWNLQVERCSLK